MRNNNVIFRVRRITAAVMAVLLMSVSGTAVLTAESVQEPEEITEPTSENETSETAAESEDADLDSDAGTEETTGESAETTQEDTVVSGTMDSIEPKAEEAEEADQTAPIVKTKLKEINTSGLSKNQLLGASGDTNIQVNITNIINSTKYKGADGNLYPGTYTFNISQSGSKNMQSQGVYGYVGGKNYKTSFYGVDYEFKNQFVLATEDSGPVYWDGEDVPSKLIKKITNKTDANGNKYMITYEDDHTEDVNGSEVYVSPVYKQTPQWLLEEQFIDDVSTGSGSWTNLGAISGYTHTFKAPDEPDDYQFLYWGLVTDPDTDKEAVKGTWKDGESVTYSSVTVVTDVTKDVTTPDGRTVKVPFKQDTYYTFWQPAVTVRYHEQGEVTKEEQSFEKAAVYDYKPEDKENIKFEGWYSDPEMTNRIDEATVETAPEITRKAGKARVIDVYARYVTTKIVTKVWDDSSNKDGSRPASVQVQLSGGTEDKTADLNRDNGWTYTFEDLTAYDTDGKEIEYTVDEVAVPKGYTKSVESEGDSFTITNKHTPTPTPAPSGSPTPKPTPTPDNVVTCQMAGYPSNYAWNEDAKACQPGFIDNNGKFHSVRSIPNTSDKGLMGSFITFLISDLLGIAAAYLLREH